MVAYNAGDYLQPCLDSLAAQTLRDFECLIADNGSADGSIERVQLPDGRFRVVDMGSNLGFAAANNAAAQQVSPEDQVVNMEQQRAKWLDEKNPAAMIIPPTALGKQLIGGDGPSEPPTPP